MKLSQAAHHRYEWNAFHTPFTRAHQVHQPSASCNLIFWASVDLTRNTTDEAQDRAVARHMRKHIHSLSTFTGCTQLNLHRLDLSITSLKFSLTISDWILVLALEHIGLSASWSGSCLAGSRYNVKAQHTELYTIFLPRQRSGQKSAELCPKACLCPPA